MSSHTFLSSCVTAIGVTAELPDGRCITVPQGDIVSYFILIGNLSILPDQGSGYPEYVDSNNTVYGSCRALCHCCACRWPVLWSLKHLGSFWLYLWARQGLGSRRRVQVSASSKLVPVAHAAEVRATSKGNLLRQLVSANVDADLYGKELVRAVINVKWDSFARAFLLMQVMI